MKLIGFTDSHNLRNLSALLTPSYCSQAVREPHLMATHFPVILATSDAQSLAWRLCAPDPSWPPPCCRFGHLQPHPQLCVHLTHLAVSTCTRCCHKLNIDYDVLATSDVCLPTISATRHTLAQQQQGRHGKGKGQGSAGFMSQLCAL